MGKHVPLRMCIGCREMKPKDNLFRIVRDYQTGEIKIDNPGKIFGRGAYICSCEDCIKLAAKKKALERVFKAPMHKMYEQIIDNFSNQSGDDK